MYNSHSYRGVKGIEKEYDTILYGYSGGKIIIKDLNGRIIRTILEKTANDGKDVRLH